MTLSIRSIIMHKSLLTLTATLLLTGPAIAQDTEANVKEIRAENCMVKFIDDTDITAEVQGKLLELRFKEGSRVNKGDVLGVIDDTAAQLTVDLKKAEEKEAELNALNDVNLKDAENSEELASAEAESYKDLYRQNATPYWEMEKKRLEAERAKLRIDLARMQKKIAEAQYIAKRNERMIAEFEQTRRMITAPFSGYIETRLAQLGEWAQPGSPIARLVRLDKLRVEGDIDALRYPGQVTRGTPVQVLVYSEIDNDNAIPFNGTIGFVSSEIDLNNRYRVWVEIDNKNVGDDWTIKPGMRAEIVIRKTGQLF